MFTGESNAVNLSWSTIREIEKGASILSSFLVDVGRSGKERVDHIDSRLLHLSNETEGEDFRN